MYTKKFTKNQYEKTKKTVYLVKKGKNHKVVRQILKNVQEVQAYLDQEIEQSHLLEIFSLLYLPKDLYNEILKQKEQKQ